MRQSRAYGNLVARYLVHQLQVKKYDLYTNPFLLLEQKSRFSQDQHIS